MGVRGWAYFEWCLTMVGLISLRVEFFWLRKGWGSGCFQWGLGVELISSGGGVGRADFSGGGGFFWLRKGWVLC